VRAAGGLAPSVHRFFWRRALRTLPLYACAVAVGTLARADGWSDSSKGLPYLLFLNSFPGLAGPLSPWGDVCWSLATEWQFYLLLPVVGLLMSTPAWRAAGALTLGLYTAAYFGFVTGQLGPTDMTARDHVTLSVFGRGPAFAAGIGAAWLCMHHGPRLRGALGSRPWLSNGVADLLLLLVLWVLGALLSSVASAGFFYAQAQWPVWHAAGSLLWGAMLLLVLLAPLRCAVLLRSRALRWTGLRS
jgi:peptidoglycan/LPS O-acetylase OafA/YrhL